MPYPGTDSPKNSSICGQALNSHNDVFLDCEETLQQDANLTYFATVLTRNTLTFGEITLHCFFLMTVSPGDLYY